MQKQNETKVIFTAPAEYHKPIAYPIAVVKDKEISTGKLFIALIVSPEGKEIFAKYGFK